MGGSWTIRKHWLDREKTRWMYLLASEGRSFLSKCRARDANRAERIEKAAGRVFDNGVSWARDAGVVTEIRTGQRDVAVFEVRIKGSVIRVATYLHEGFVPIYLFDFDTHAGSRNNLPRHHIDRALDMARTARDCAMQYDFEEYRGHAR